MSFTKKCENCNKIIKKRQNTSKKVWAKQRFCSKQCGYEKRKKDSHKECVCVICKKTFITRKKLKGIYCSDICKNSVGYWTGKERDDNTKTKISETKKEQGIVTPGAFKPGGNPWNKGLEYLEISGDKHWNWKGGITDANKTIRHSVEYNEWRKLVYKRDNWTCKICNKKQRKPVAHHIKSFKSFEDLRFDINNGVTLCRSCHMAIHKKDGVLKSDATYQFIFS